MAMETLCSSSQLMHKLELEVYHKPYTCDGCKETGFGPRYRCRKCNFELHKACMLALNAPTKSHEFFPGSTFVFLRTPPKPCHPGCILRCDACRNTINGFVFHCKKDNLDLHPGCKNLKKSYRIEDVEFNLHRKVKKKCMWCKTRSLKDNGWSYISKYNGKEYHVHVACLTEMYLEQWYKNGGNVAEQSLALKMSPKEIQVRGRGNWGKKNKIWRILKILLQTIVSIVIGDPTTIVASFFLQLIAP